MQDNEEIVTEAQRRHYAIPLHQARPAAEGPLRSLAAVEEEHIHRVLAATQGNQSEAARILGISRNTLARKLRSEAD